MKNSKLIMILITVMLLVSSINFVGFAKENSSEEVSNPEQNPYLPLIEETDYKNIFLPLVTNNYCVSPYDSPFSLQIAGLSDFTTTSSLTTMTKAEYDEIQKMAFAELDAAFPNLVQALEESGAGWARIYIDWAVIDDIGWTWYNEKLELVASTGVKIIATVANPPGWAVINPDGILNDPEYYGTDTACSNVLSDSGLVAYEAFLDELVRKYKEAPYNINTWEIMNEPDAVPGYRCVGGGLVTYGLKAGKYVELTSRSHEIIKGIDPSAKIILGGLAYDWFYDIGEIVSGEEEYFTYVVSPDGPFNRYFIDDYFDVEDSENYIDAINFHYFKDWSGHWEQWTQPYKDDRIKIPTCGYVADGVGASYTPYGTGVIAKGSHILERIKICHGVTKPLWISEVGHHGTDNTDVIPEDREEDYDLANQARYVWKVYPQALSLGAENVTWYALKIIRSVTRDDYQGLLDDNNNPKPAFYAYQTLTSELTGYKFDSIVNAGISNEIYKFYNPCEGYKIVAWYNTTDVNATNIWDVSGVSEISLKYRPIPEGGVLDRDVIDGGSGDLDGVKNGSIRIGLTMEPVIIHLYP